MLLFIQIFLNLFSRGKGRDAAHALYARQLRKLSLYYRIPLFRFGKVRHTHIRIQFYLLFDYNFGIFPYRRASFTMSSVRSVFVVTPLMRILERKPPQKASPAPVASTACTL